MRNTMKRWFTLLSLIFVLVWSGCDFDPITNAVDDFNIVVELEDINTGFSIGVFDSETKAIIERDVTITFDSVTALNMIDIFSDPISGDTFDGGFFGAGVRNEVIPTTDDPFQVTAILRADGYLDKELNFSLVDTGGTSLNVDMISENNLPTGYAVDTFVAPVDSEGNALPLPSPIDTTTGELLVPLSKTFINSQNVLFPRFRGANMNDLQFTLEDGHVFRGNPHGYQITTYVWNPRTPEFNRGQLVNCTRSISTIINPCVDDLAQKKHYTRNIAEILNVELLNPTTGLYSAIDEIKFIGNNPEEAKNIMIDLLVLTPDRTEFWHDKYKENVEIYIFSRFLGVGVIGTGDVGVESRNPILWFLFEQPKNEELERFDFLNYPRVLTLTSGVPSFADPLSRDVLILQKEFIKQQHDDVYAFVLPNNIATGYPDATGLYASLEEIDLRVRIDGIDDIDFGAVGMTLDTDGHTFLGGYLTNRVYLFDNIPKSTVNITVNLPHTTYTEFVDLTNYAGEIISVTPPQPSSTLVSATINANLKCKSANKELNISGFPIHNVAVRYRPAGETGTYPRVATVTDMNYNAGSQVLEGIEVEFPGVEIGQTYEFIFSVDAFSETTTQVIDSENFTVELEVRDSYCQDK